jgi:hypothetical protein
MQLFEEAEKVRPEGNDDSMLRWNRCARLVQRLQLDERMMTQEFDEGDSPPLMSRVRGAGAK